MIVCGHNANIYWEDGRTKEINPGLRSGLIRNMDELGGLTFDDNMITLYMLHFRDCYYLDDNMIAYCQLENSSWNMRTENQKNMLNALDYYEEISFAPEMKKYSAARHFCKYLWLFRARNDEKVLTDCKEWLGREEEIHADILLNIRYFRGKSFLEKLWCNLDVTFFIFYGIIYFYTSVIKMRIRSR